MIYCQGELLHTVALLGVYSDPKTFVDKPLKKDPKVVLENFKKKFRVPITINDRDAVRDFIDENFEKEGSDIEQLIFENLLLLCYFNFINFSLITNIATIINIIYESSQYIRSVT